MKEILSFGQKHLQKAPTVRLQTQNKVSFSEESLGGYPNCRFFKKCFWRFNDGAKFIHFSYHIDYIEWVQETSNTRSVKVLQMVSA